MLLGGMLMVKMGVSDRQQRCDALEETWPNLNSTALMQQLLIILHLVFGTAVTHSYT